MNKTFGSLKLRHRLYAGFAVIVLLLAGAIATMLWQVGRIDEVTNRIANLRTPTALTAERLTADVQGTLAALRGYLLTGNDAFKAERQGAWTDIDAAAGKMDGLSSNWTNPDNVKAWSAFKAGLDEFRGAQGKVESSADFTNIKPAVDLLVHEAAPRGKHLLEILVGAIGADGLRTGGMVDDQVGLLQSDTASGAAASAALLLTEWILLVVGVVIGGGIAFITARAISRPLVGMTDAMGQLADGSLDVAVPGKDRRDEIGDMAGAVEVFKQNAIRVRDMNGAEAERQAEAQRRAEAMHNLMSRLSSVVRAATEGNFNERIELQLTDSDLAAVANGVNDLVGTVDRGLGETGGVLSSLAQTDLTRRVEGEYRGAFAQLKTDTNAVVENLAGVVGQLRGTSGALRTATREILSGANDLANRTTKQAAAVEETSAAMEQLAKTVNDNAKRAEQANTESQAVSVIGAEAGDVMKQSNNAMDRISASSGRISNIIGLIDDIAFQTNLLALNASVEAARAGEAGKGFAVVAIEVRRLAQSAAEASSEVKKLIDQSAGEVTEGSKLVADATRRLEAMLERLHGSTRLVEEIARATQDQSTAIGEVTIAVRMLDEMTQHNAALVEETNAAIEQTEAQAVELDQVVETFRVNAPSAPAKGTPSYQQRRSAA